LVALFLLAPDVLAAEPTQPQREEIERIIKEYLLREPTVIYEALQELQQRREADQQEHQKGLVATKKSEIFKNGDDPIVGNPDGDVVLVEFFDYHCGYCRSMMPGIRNMVDQDRNIRLVLKDFPILGADSVTAAKAALASQKQGRYADMHWALMQSKDLTRDGVFAVAKRLGLDTDKLAVDMDSPEIKARIDHNLQLAQALDIGGTPTFIFGDRVVPGAIPVNELTKLLGETRAAN
jgi:protein-disulfide isomerase